MHVNLKLLIYKIWHLKKNNCFLLQKYNFKKKIIITLVWNIRVQYVNIIFNYLSKIIFQSLLWKEKLYNIYFLRLILIKIDQNFNNLNFSILSLKSPFYHGIFLKKVYNPYKFYLKKYVQQNMPINNLKIKYFENIKKHLIYKKKYNITLILKKNSQVFSNLEYYKVFSQYMSPIPVLKSLKTKTKKLNRLWITFNYNIKNSFTKKWNLWLHNYFNIKKKKKKIIDETKKEKRKRKKKHKFYFQTYVAHHPKSKYTFFKKKKQVKFLFVKTLCFKFAFYRLSFNLVDFKKIIVSKKMLCKKTSENNYNNYNFTNYRPLKLKKQKKFLLTLHNSKIFPFSAFKTRYYFFYNHQKHYGFRILNTINEYTFLPKHYWPVQKTSMYNQVFNRLNIEPIQKTNLLFIFFYNKFAWFIKDFLSLGSTTILLTWKYNILTLWRTFLKKIFQIKDYFLPFSIKDRLINPEWAKIQVKINYYSTTTKKNFIYKNWSNYNYTVKIKKNKKKKFVRKYHWFKSNLQNQHTFKFQSEILLKNNFTNLLPQITKYKYWLNFLHLLYIKSLNLFFFSVVKSRLYISNNIYSNILKYLIIHSKKFLNDYDSITFTVLNKKIWIIQKKKKININSLLNFENEIDWIAIYKFIQKQKQTKSNKLILTIFTKYSLISFLIKKKIILYEKIFQKYLKYNIIMDTSKKNPTKNIINSYHGLPINNFDYNKYPYKTILKYFWKFSESKQKKSNFNYINCPLFWPIQKIRNYKSKFVYQSYTKTNWYFYKKKYKKKFLNWKIFYKVFNFLEYKLYDIWKNWILSANLYYNLKNESNLTLIYKLYFKNKFFFRRNSLFNILWSYIIKYKFFKLYNLSFHLKKNYFLPIIDTKNFLYLNFYKRYKKNPRYITNKKLPTLKLKINHHEYLWTIYKYIYILLAYSLKKKLNYIKNLFFLQRRFGKTFFPKNKKILYLTKTYNLFLFNLYENIKNLKNNSFFKIIFQKNKFLNFIFFNKSNFFLGFFYKYFYCKILNFLFIQNFNWSNIFLRQYISHIKYDTHNQNFIYSYYFFDKLSYFYKTLNKLKKYKKHYYTYNYYNYNNKYKKKNIFKQKLLNNNLKNFLLYYRKFTLKNNLYKINLNYNLIFPYTIFWRYYNKKNWKYNLNIKKKKGIHEKTRKSKFTKKFHQKISKNTLIIKNLIKNNKFNNFFFTNLKKKLTNKKLKKIIIKLKYISSFNYIYNFNLLKVLQQFNFAPTPTFALFFIQNNFICINNKIQKNYLYEININDKISINKKYFLLWKWFLYKFWKNLLNKTNKKSILTTDYYSRILQQNAKNNIVQKNKYINTTIKYNNFFSFFFRNKKKSLIHNWQKIQYWNQNTPIEPIQSNFIFQNNFLINYSLGQIYCIYKPKNSFFLNNLKKQKQNNNLILNIKLIHFLKNYFNKNN